MSGYWPQPLAQFSVIVPAYNEEAVIGRCLSALLADAPPDDFEIIVVCNGCRDETAAVARGFAGVQVIELEIGSKPAALNEGVRAARARPCFFVDADVVVSFSALEAAARALAEPGVKAVAPKLRVDLDGCSWPVRAYYKVWRQQPYVQDGLVGSGVYGLSADGLRVVGAFPNIIADDGYVRSRFAASERRSVAADADARPIEFVVFPPRDAASLVRIEARRREGDAQLRARHPSPQTEGSTTAGSALSGLFRRYNPVDLAAYLTIKTAGRVLYQLRRISGRSGLWLRDDSSRQTSVA